MALKLIGTILYAADWSKGFYTKEELQTLIERRYSRKDLKRVWVKLALQDVIINWSNKASIGTFSSLNQNRLKGLAEESLLVMATGS
jgi:type I restriction enzyme R subunit